ncbi:MAG TPA: hypothetical protein VF678_04810 [bacterium]
MSLLLLGVAVTLALIAPGCTTFLHPPYWDSRAPRAIEAAPTVGFIVRCAGDWKQTARWRTRFQKVFQHSKERMVVDQEGITVDFCLTGNDEAFISREYPRARQIWAELSFYTLGIVPYARTWHRNATLTVYRDGTRLGVFTYAWNRTAAFGWIPLMMSPALLLTPNEDEEGEAIFRQFAHDLAGFLASEHDTL